MKKILITGAAGFIGYHLIKRLIIEDCFIIGIDNINDYYSPQIKEDRLSDIVGEEVKDINNINKNNFIFLKENIDDMEKMQQIFEKYSPEIVINLAAQAGVRYSIENPKAYIDSNIIGFFNILECCRKYPVKHLIFASSSSVYGANKKVPYSTEDKVDTPVSLYAATKKADELLAYSYSKLYGIKTTGLRFFTVYGPFGRPDMAYFSFTNKILNDKSIQIYNNGDMYRDFTYVDDIVEGIIRLIEYIPKKDENNAFYKIYNIGNNNPVKLMDFIEIIEEALGKKAKKEFLPMQPGDVYQTYADIEDLKNDIGFAPKTDLREGINKFVKWYMEYFK